MPLYTYDEFFWAPHDLYEEVFLGLRMTSMKSFFGAPRDLFSSYFP